VRQFGEDADSNCRYVKCFKNSKFFFFAFFSFFDQKLSFSLPFIKPTASVIQRQAVVAIVGIVGGAMNLI
jgi:hypothetical protein